MSQLEREGMSLIGGGVREYLELLCSNWNRSERRGVEVDDRLLSPAEMKLAEALRKLGLTFEQQYAIGPYDADFYFIGALICVEVDGKHHEERHVQDRRRDEYLRERGIRTMRFSARNVFEDAYACADVIAAAVKKAEGEEV